MHPEARRSDLVATPRLTSRSRTAPSGRCAPRESSSIAGLSAVLELHRLTDGDPSSSTTRPSCRAHEEPQLFRYTGHGLRALLERTGLEVAEVRPFGGCFSTLGSLLHNLGSMSGRDVRPAGSGPALLQAGSRRANFAFLDRLDRPPHPPLRLQLSRRPAPPQPGVERLLHAGGDGAPPPEPRVDDALQRRGARLARQLARPRVEPGVLAPQAPVPGPVAPARRRRKPCSGRGDGTRRYSLSTRRPRQPCSSAWSQNSQSS